MSPEPTVYDRVAQHGHVLLAGVVGSTAYGLAREGSDTDRLGVFAVPTRELFRLSTPDDTRVYKEPGDAAFHEAAKYARLALACNPTVTELMWLTEYEHVTEHGEALVALREKFLSAERVKSAYLGYAQSQFTRLQNRSDGTFSSDTRARAPKHARHMARLVNQGYELYTTGHLTVKVDDPDWYHQFSSEDPQVWAEWFADAAARFAAANTCLPTTPDAEAVENWLLNVRMSQLST